MALSIGIDLGGTKCLGVLVQPDGRVQAEHRLITPRGPAAVVDTVVGMATALLGRAGGQGAVIGVGIGAPGLVDNDGVLRFAPNLPGVAHLALREEVEVGLAAATGSRLGVRVENDAACAAWGERMVGAARGADHALLVTLGTGIGGGVVVGGQLERGANGFAAEIGHMVVDPHGPRCGCGKRGCWERFASGSGLGLLAREAAHAGQADRVVELAGGDPEAVRGEHVTAGAAEGDEQAQAVMDSLAWWLALGLANLASIFDPEVFVLGGGLVEAGGVLLEPTRRAFTELLQAARYRPEIRLVPAELGEYAGAVGAALLAPGVVPTVASTLAPAIGAPVAAAAPGVAAGTAPEGAAGTAPEVAASTAPEVAASTAPEVAASTAPEGAASTAPEGAPPVTPFAAGAAPAVAPPPPGVPPAVIPAAAPEVLPHAGPDAGPDSAPDAAPEGGHPGPEDGSEAAEAARSPKRA